MTTDTKRLRGLAALVTDAVDHGSAAIERVHMATAARPFAILEAVPIVDRPTRLVRAAHDVSVRATYAAIRLVARVAGAVADRAIVRADLDSD